MSTVGIHIFPRVIIIILLFVYTGCAHIDQTHRKACEQLVNLAQNIDALLADPQEEEDYHKTRLKLCGGAIWEEGDGTRFSTRSKVKIPLPGLKKRWGVLIAGESEKEDETLQGITDVGDRTYESFLRFFSQEEEYLNWGLDVGLRYKGGPKTFVRLRGRHNGWFHCSRTRFIQYFYWKSGEGFSAKNYFDMDQRLTPHLLLREFSELVYGEESEGLEIKGGVSLRSITRQGLAWSVNMTHFGATDPWGYRYMEVSFQFRRNLFRPWFEIEITPALKVKRKEGLWDMDPRVELFFNLIFDAIHAY